MNNQDIASKIEDLERQLKELRLQIEKKIAGPYKKVTALIFQTHGKGKEREGIVQKINTLTGYASVRTEKKRRIVRKIKNLVKKGSRS